MRVNLIVPTTELSTNTGCLKGEGINRMQGEIFGAEWGAVFG